MEQKKPLILIIDDNPAIQHLLKVIINQHTNYDVVTADTGELGLEIADVYMPDLILLDIMMPGLDGFETTQKLKENQHTAHIPVIFITGLENVEDKIKAFEVGAVDYIVKSFEQREVISRINTHIKLNHLVEKLEDEVRQRTRELEKLNLVLVSALENANSFNDDDTGNHIKRVSFYSKILAMEYGLDDNMVNEIDRYASLHDIGKVGIPGNILKKNSSLGLEEWEVMKTHCEIGFKMIDFPEFSSVAKNIVLYHHEKWDGSGYPQGLSGEDIPVEARVVAMADVYDALRSRRPYKEPFPAEKAYDIIVESTGSHFDPQLVEVFKNNHQGLSKIFHELSD